jgi:hypothetical protein
MQLNIYTRLHITPFKIIDYISCQSSTICSDSSAQKLQLVTSNFVLV